MAPLVPPINSWHLVFYGCVFSSCLYDALQSLSHAFDQSPACFTGMLSINDTGFTSEGDRVPFWREDLGWGAPTGNPQREPCTPAHLGACSCPLNLPGSAHRWGAPCRAGCSSPCSEINVQR